ncbi:MAG: hypothetical protein IKT50_03245 [Clostridia bacterium]|nr:hypothetical protein [Clostridia bacterium]
MDMELIVALMTGLLILFFSYCRQIRKRLQMMWKLFCLEKKGGAKVTWLRHPILSAFQKQKGFDFICEYKEKTYYVSILSTRYRHREHFFASPTELYVHRKLRLFRAAGGRVRARINEFNLDLGSKIVPIDLTQKAPEGAETALLFYPVAKDVLGLQGTKKVYLGNGDVVFGDYRLYTLSAFIDGLESGLYKRKQKVWKYD